MRDFGSKVGIDATARNVEVARLHAAEGGLRIDYRHAAAEELAEAGESFDDATVSAPSGEVSVHPNCEGGNHWIAEWLDSDGGCYVTTCDGTLAELRARDYLGALKPDN